MKTLLILITAFTLTGCAKLYVSKPMTKNLPLLDLTGFVYGDSLIIVSYTWGLGDGACILYPAWIKTFSNLSGTPISNKGFPTAVVVDSVPQHYTVIIDYGDRIDTMYFPAVKGHRCYKCSYVSPNPYPTEAGHLKMKEAFETALSRQQ